MGKIIKWSRFTLGKVPDSVVAKQAGAHIRSVYRVRKRLGIPPWRPHQLDIDWGKVDLGKRIDRAVAEDLGVSTSAVHRHRTRLGIPATENRAPSLAKELILEAVSNRTLVPTRIIVERVLGELGRFSRRQIERHLAELVACGQLHVVREGNAQDWGYLRKKGV